MVNQFVCAFVLGILPILSPYILIGPVYVTMFILAWVVGGIIITKKQPKILLPKALYVLWITHFMLAGTAVFTTRFNISLINGMVVGTFNLICMSILWANCKRTLFMEYANKVGIISSAFLMIQAVYLGLDFKPPSGRIPGFELIGHVQWVQDTWGYRLNSFFQEPSYFAIYILPLMAYSLEKKRYALSIVYTIALVMSSSSLGIIGVILIIGYHFLIEERKVKELIILVGGLTIIHTIGYNLIMYYNHSVWRSIEKITNILQESQMRLTGYIYMFKDLPIINQLFGVGLGQMQNYFGTQGIYINNYSNAYVITLMNTGIIGLSVFVAFQVYHLTKAKRKVYVFIFIMVCAVDAFMYNSFFYYIMTYFILEKYRDIECVKMKGYSIWKYCL